MSTATANPRTEHKPFSRKQSIALVFGCTILGAAAQVLIKTGANQLSHPGVWAMLTSLPIVSGYSLYGISTVLLIFALRDGELSMLYPIIALTYIWVTMLSVVFFREAMNFFKLAGISAIVAGVGVLGRGRRR